MAEERVSHRAEFELPFGRKAILKNVEFDSGLDLLRLTLRENRRFTLIDLDSDSAEQLGKELLSWANEVSRKSSSPDGK